MNRLFVVVLCRFSILVRVGPARRGATNQYLGDEGIFQNPVPVFCVHVFPVQGRSNEHWFFSMFVTISCEGKTGTLFFGTILFFGPRFSV